ncbi:MAG: hypothetical protein ACI4UV_08400 [Victivallales bacterium]
MSCGEKERNEEMYIEELKIEFNRWGENKGKYTAVVKLRDKKNELSIVMNPEVSIRLLPLVAEELCKAAADYADDLRQKLNNATKHWDEASTC